MTDNTVDEPVVEVDPFAELQAGRIDLQAFTQALWRFARESRHAAESALSRLDTLANEGVLDATKYQELKSMTRSLMENADSRETRKIHKPISTSRTAIERQKVQFLEGVVRNYAHAPSQEALHAEARERTPQADPDNGATHAEHNDDAPPMQLLKPAADAQSTTGAEQGAVIAPAAVKSQSIAGASVHQAATVDASLETVQLNTAEHLTFEAESEPEAIHSERTVPLATRPKKSNARLWVLCALVAVVLVSWYAQNSGLVDIKASVMHLSERLSTIDLFNDSPLSAQADVGGPDQGSGANSNARSSGETPQVTVNRDGNAMVSDVRLGKQENVDAARAGDGFQETISDADGEALTMAARGISRNELGDDAASESLYQELVQATRSGNLEPASAPGTALHLLQALQHGGASTIRVQRARARIAQAYLNQARTARQARDWAKAELLVSKAVRLRQGH